MSLDEMITNAKNKSIGKQKDKVIRLSEKKVKRVVVLAITTIALLCATNLGQAGFDFVDNIQRNMVISRALSESNGVVNSNTHRTSDFQNYYYDVDNIVDYIVEDQEEIPARLYGTLNAMGFDKGFASDERDAIISKVFQNEDGTKEYKSFEDFLVKNKFVDENGLPSIKAYREKMDEYIYAKKQFEEQSESIKGIR